MAVFVIPLVAFTLILVAAQSIRSRRARERKLGTDPSGDGGAPPTDDAGDRAASDRPAA